jgi:hypothetical protein
VNYAESGRRKSTQLLPSAGRLRDDGLDREQVDIRNRIKQAYIDNIDGKIDDNIFSQLVADYKQDERKITRELERRMDADHGYLDEGIRLIGIARVLGGCSRSPTGKAANGSCRCYFRTTRTPTERSQQPTVSLSIL